MSKFGAKKKSQFGFVFPVAPKPCAVKDQSGIGTYKRIGTLLIDLSTAFLQNDVYGSRDILPPNYKPAPSSTGDYALLCFRPF